MPHHFAFGDGGNRKFDALISEAIFGNTSGYDPKKVAGHIAHDLTIKALKMRSKKGLTGEWIVFQKYKGHNYYLTIGTHDEGDKNIFARVRQGYDMNFSFLRKARA